MPTQSSTHGFGALPFFPGSKKRLVPLIFGLVDEVLPPAARRESVFVDAFLGGAAVALSAKRLGYGTVLASDLAERSVVIGRALIENEATRLSEHDVLRLFAPTRVPEVGLPDILDRLMPSLRATVACAWTHLQEDATDSVRHDLLTTLLFDVLVRAFPMSLPSATDAVHAAAGTFDRVSAARLPHYLRAERRLARPQAWLQLAGQINAAITPGAARVFQGDALELLPTMTGDVLVLDPPYGKTSSYEAAFQLIDDCIGVKPITPSKFSGSVPPLDQLLDAARGFRIVVLCYGNALLSQEELVDLVARHRDVRRVVAVPYRHYGSIATQTKNETNREFMVLATRPGGR